MYNFLILMFTITMVNSMPTSTSSYYTASATAQPTTYSSRTNYITGTTTAWYPFYSSTRRASTPSPSSWNPYSTTYPPYISTPWPTRSPISTIYPTPSPSSWNPYSTTYPRYISTPWPTKSPISTIYPTPPPSSWNPYSTTYPTYRTTPPSTASAWPSLQVTVEPFTVLIVPAARNVVLQTTSTPSDYTVEFKCPEYMINYVSAKVINMVLNINSPSDCDVIIRAYEYQILEIGHIVSLTTYNNLKGNRLQIKTEGTSSIVLNNIVYNMVEVVLSNSSSITLSGSTPKLDVVQASRGNFDALFLSTDYVSLITKSSGSVRIKSNNQFELTVEGEGDIIWCSPHADINVKPGEFYTSSKVVYSCD